jgi:hypothetical protein
MKQYKYKRKKEEQSHDAPPKHLRLEGAERVRAKNLIRKELTTIETNKDLDVLDMINEEAKKGQDGI